VAHLDGLDVLVNNAGIAGPTAGVEDVSPDQWDRTMAVNMVLFLCSEAGSKISGQALSIDGYTETLRG
jgi:NAD(P)-dependent dehydrogenase (short-subunit alcohol dehydrogenase family)